MFCHQFYRFALAEADLTDGAFMTWGLPPPDSAPYAEYTEAVGQSDGGQAQLGYDQVVFTWVNLSPDAGYNLRQLYDAAVGADGEGYLYATVNRLAGLAPGAEWIDVRAKPHMPTLTSPDNQAGLSDLYHPPVVFVLNNIEILNAPSLYSVE